MTTPIPQNDEPPLVSGGNPPLVPSGKRKLTGVQIDKITDVLCDLARNSASPGMLELVRAALMKELLVLNSDSCFV